MSRKNELEPIDYRTDIEQYTQLEQKQVHWRVVEDVKSGWPVWQVVVVIGLCLFIAYGFYDVVGNLSLGSSTQQPETGSQAQPLNRGSVSPLPDLPRSLYGCHGWMHFVRDWIQSEPLPSEGWYRFDTPPSDVYRFEIQHESIERCLGGGGDVGYIFDGQYHSLGYQVLRDGGQYVFRPNGEGSVQYTISNYLLPDSCPDSYRYWLRYYAQQFDGLRPGDVITFNLPEGFASAYYLEPLRACLPMGMLSATYSSDGFVVDNQLRAGATITFVKN